jgi:carbonic anhydrase
MTIARRSMFGLPLVVAGGVAATRLLPDAAVAAADVPHQSPIDIRPADVRRVTGLPPLRVHYSAHTPVSVHYVSKDGSTGNGCEVRGSEETEEVEVEAGAGHVTLGDHRFDLLQFHFHTRSEHTINGHHAPLEMHLVHQDAHERKLVIGVLLRAGRASEVDRILTQLPEECGEPIEVDDFDLASLVPRSPATLRYQGSLTTDPYTEGVRWHLTVPSTTSAAGIKAFQKVFPQGDSRPTQPLNHRRVVADPGWHARG